jgi:hypothetical protein
MSTAYVSGRVPARYERLVSKQARAARTSKSDLVARYVIERSLESEFPGSRFAIRCQGEEAEKVWAPKFIAEIVSGKDPRATIERETKFERPTTVADLLKLYRTRYVEVEPLKSRAGDLERILVGAAGLEPATPCAQGRPGRACEVLIAEHFAAPEKPWAQIWAHLSGDERRLMASRGE